MISEQASNLIAIAVCVLLSAFFSATETAFSSLNKTRLKVLAEKGNSRASLALTLSGDYDKLISTILIGNNVVNIAASAIATIFFVSLLGGIGPTVSTVVTTIVVLIFSEITPKSIAKDYPEAFAMFASPIIRAAMWAFAPLNYVFSLWKRMVSRLFGGRKSAGISQEELLMLLEEAEKEGELDQEEGELLRNAVEFGDLEAKDILTHRVDLEAVSITDSKEKIARVFTESRYSRLLVYEDTIDKIVGVIHLKDFYQGTGLFRGSIRNIMATPVYVYQTEKIGNLLRILQANKSHVAVVIDAYGGTLGIVTMEDILEEIVGDIWDEHDEVEEAFRLMENGVWTVDCSVSLDDFREHFSVAIDSDCVSLGGWVMEEMGRIPEEGDRFDYENLTVTVTKLDDRRVETVTVAVRPPEEEAREARE
ncbi:MAG: HlyC/CorC family transporter [Clostridia bacterium]|nr:HlyC/CorC family transporter [Clostridia bacterium]